MRISAALLLGGFVVALAFVNASPVAAAPPKLINVLSSVRDLNEAQFTSIVRWAREGAPRPMLGSGHPLRWLQNEILDLSDRGQRAILVWMRTGNRTQLRQLGVSDSEIGSRDPDNFARPAETPNPWRSLQFGSSAIGNPTFGHIEVLGGWAAVRRDNRGARACVSFKNVGAVAATRVVFEFPITDRSETRLGELTLDRRGTFSPGIGIHSWGSMAAWQQSSNRGYDENCATLELNVASFPLRNAHFATYRIQRVDYANGTSWTPEAGP